MVRRGVDPRVFATVACLLSLYILARPPRASADEAPTASEGGGAAAANVEEHKPADPDTGKSTLSPDTLGLIPQPLEPAGIRLTGTYVADAFYGSGGNAGRHVTYEGRLNGALDVDLDRFASWRGASFHCNAFEIHGESLSRDYLHNFLAASSIEAAPALRLYELWLEQQWLGKRVSLRAGQMTADTEFFVTQYSDAFLNSTLGWPAVHAADLPAGGPSIPLAALGARINLQPIEDVTWLGAVFDGDAAGPGEGDPERRNGSGINFRVNDPPLLLTELQYAHHQTPTPGSLLPGRLKLGGWYHAGSFEDQRFTPNGLSQADPRSIGRAAELGSDHAIYVVAEQALASFGERNGDRGIGTFVRFEFAPADRNVIDRYVDAGINIAGLFATRASDKIGIGFAYAHVSDAGRDLDRDFRRFRGENDRVRDYEALTEVGYLAELTRGLTIHPCFQYVFHRAGGSIREESGAAAKATGDASIIGVRTTIKF